MQKIETHIIQLKKGSYKSFTAVYDFFAPQLYAFLFSLTHSKSRSKDILQETFLKVWEKRTEIDINLSFKSYLFTIAKNRLLNELREELKSPVFSDYLDFAFFDKGVDSEIENQIDFDRFKKYLQKTKEKLSPRQRQIFELNKEEGVSIKEIADKLSITEQVVRNQLSIAIKILRTEMNKFFFLFALFFS